MKRKIESNAEEYNVTNETITLFWKWTKVVLISFGSGIIGLVLLGIVLYLLGYK